MSSGPRPASANALRMQAMIGLPSGLDRVRWNESDFAAAFDNAEDARAARAGVIEIFQHQRAGAFRHARSRRGSWRTAATRCSRRVVLRRQRRKQREADQRFRVDRAVGADRKRGFAFAAPDGLDAELDGGGAGCAGGGERNRRAFGAEMIGERGRPTIAELRTAGDRGELRPRATRSEVADSRHSSLAPAASAIFDRWGHSTSSGGGARNSGPGKSPLLPMPDSAMASSAAKQRHALGQSAGGM